jgi:hypothetical protein
MRTLLVAAAILTIVPLLVACALPVPDSRAPLAALGQASRVALLFESVSL